MKKIISFVLVITLVFSTFAFVENTVLAKSKKPTKVEKLFKKNKLPTSETEMGKYLKTIKVKIWVRTTKKVKKKTKVVFKKSSMKLRVHKKLASKFKSAFNKMYSAKFPIKIKNTTTYCWKYIIGTNSLSTHSYGIAIDINCNDNPCFNNTNVNVSGGYGSYRPGKNKYSVTPQVIKIWKKLGFDWGGDWSGKKDTMHFEYN